jgi:lambda repressor-like predicted transcriptional regulator
MNDSREVHREYVRELIRVTGLSSSRLAMKAGLAPSTLNRFLTQDTNHLLSWRTLEAIRNAAIAEAGIDKVPPLPTNSETFGVSFSHFHSALGIPEPPETIDDPEEHALLKLWRRLNHRQKQLFFCVGNEISKNGVAEP